MGLDQSLPDLAGDGAVFGVFLQSLLIHLDGFLRLGGGKGRGDY